MTNPTAAMLVIGDEILSGRTRDSNAHHLAGRLDAYGIDLREVRVVADDRDAIVDAVRALSAAYDQLFTSGGIGPTHDDITAESVAAAFDAPISVREDARAILAAHYDARGIELNAARLRMARIPDGASLIENAVSAAPGFSLGNAHVMAGVPKIFEAMLDALLPSLAHGAARQVRQVEIVRGEGDIAEALSSVAETYPSIAIGSYPTSRDGQPLVRILLRGDEVGMLDEAEKKVRDLLDEPAS
ncbi:molybdenum cofactor synthesis domain-containing protein [Palleronia aestuarii]|uniref:Molybdenum cofactor synthesis domain-containing protein n=1 Tax=Palleronia aestuarii TaxID=568105 RepID=A0A2W7P627_9RHOB|nr:molybdopterin-binding protein [Palleronia aestuarii]PZX18862.1 molybdenum cofactor synthesis domain-containing protein [Palleronia aestuarii]